MASYNPAADGVVRPRLTAETFDDSTASFEMTNLGFDQKPSTQSLNELLRHQSITERS